MAVCGSKKFSDKRVNFSEVQSNRTRARNLFISEIYLLATRGGALMAS